MSQRVPEYTAKYTVLSNLDQYVELSSNYQEIFTFDSTCTVEQMQFKFDSNRVKVRITIDNFKVIEIDCRELFNFIGNKEHPQILFWDNADKLLYFNPKHPIQVKQYVKVEALSTNANWWGSNQHFLGKIITLQHWTEL